ncbi:MAG: acyltransferase family protein [Vicinamibacterales bacterium]
MSPDRYESLDLWRGVACLLVIVFHVFGYRPEGESSTAWWIAERTWIGVPLFFVISGYCITAAAARSAVSDEPMRRFFWRRLRRIFPPAWCVLGAVAALMVAVPWLYSQPLSGFVPFIRPETMTPWQWTGNVTLTFSWLYHATGEPGRLLAHYWTLCYEEQFYLVSGLAVVASRRHWLPLLGIVTAVVIAARVAIPTEDIDGYFFDGRWLLFACGIGVYAHLHRASGLSRLCAPAACMAGLVWAVTSPDVHDARFPFSLEVLEASIFALVLMGLYTYDDRLAGRPRWLQWVGERSFSIYLVHWPISRAIVQVATALGIVGFWPHAVTSLPFSVGVSLLAAAGFHVVVERRFVSRYRRPVNRETRPRGPYEAALSR